MAVEINGIVNWHAIGNILSTDHAPEVILGLLGTTILFVMTCYLKNKDSFVYKLLVFFGLVIGIIATIFCVGHPVDVTKGTLIIIAIGGFALITRPFQNIRLALIIAIFGMVMTYIALADVHEPIDFLNNKELRIVVSFAIGSVIYMILGFLQGITFELARFLNAWPILMIIGIICIIEAICLCIGHNSILDSIVG